MVQRCWNKGPLGPTVATGCFVLYYFNERDGVAEALARAFGGKVVDAREAPDPDEVVHEKALVWCW
ncbi:hypothetical protein Igni_0834 [Ignicoccus hospitalis KIN4/I]|uniref:Uncharacterized protein n=1 Tax=Ignicoccus hospitalis (strain KIN4/I / DSM 18386 / JCM 14125) TaxID=453591 RepID=A8AAR4_IGNH4|nr:hypothetical protein Igni_0834 [Ignicoccus hospitalis KIN4/I]HIH90973.1 hypothetical protein [Desulfurococcaceae archaeon]